MKMRPTAHWVHRLCALVLALWVASAVQAESNQRVLLVTGRGLSDAAEEALIAAISSEAETIDPSEYQKLARSKGQLATSDAALERIAPSLHPDLIVVASKAGAKLHVQYRDGRSGEVLGKDSLPAAAAHRGGAKLKARVKQSLRKWLASASPGSGSGSVSRTPPVAAEPIASEPDDAIDDGYDLADQTHPPPQAADADPEPESADEENHAADSEPFLFELSAGIGGATRDSTLPTRLGEQQLNTGLYPGVSIGVRLGGMLGQHALLQASADYRTSVGLQGAESQRATEMSTPLRSHGVGFGIEPGYRFGAADSVSLVVHLGWYFRGLRPIAQLALPDLSWNAAVLRPELRIPFSSSVMLRVAPELLIVAGLETSLPDASGLAHTGTGLGGEVSLDVRVAAALSLRLEYRESHVSLGTAWAANLTDVERFGAVRVVLHY